MFKIWRKFEFLVPTNVVWIEKHFKIILYLSAVHVEVSQVFRAGERFCCIFIVI